MKKNNYKCNSNKEKATKSCWASWQHFPSLASPRQLLRHTYCTLCSAQLHSALIFSSLLFSGSALLFSAHLCAVTPSSTHSLGTRAPGESVVHGWSTTFEWCQPQYLDEIHIIWSSCPSFFYWIFFCRKYNMSVKTPWYKIHCVVLQKLQIWKLVWVWTLKVPFLKFN